MSEMCSDGDYGHQYHPSGNWLELGSFKEILLERKLKRKEMAQWRRRDEIRQIQEMKSKEGLDPLNIFPGEVWLMILEEMRAEEKGNMVKLHKLFCNLLSSTTIRDIMLPTIIAMTPQPPPFLEKYFPCFRIVSSSLRDAVDQYFENRLLSELHLENGNIFRQSWIPSIELSIDRPQEVEGKLEMLMNRPNLKRFFLRSLIIEIDPFRYHSRFYSPRDYIHFSNRISLLLRHIGDQIWRFMFYCDCDQSGIVSFLPTILQEWLVLMPNLKWLELRFFNGGICEFESNLEGNVALEESEMRAIPTLFDLERVDFYLDTDKLEAFDICEAILAANPQVKVLRFGGEGNDLGRIQPELVQSLDLETLALDEGTGEEQEITYLESRINFNWKLKKIYMSLNAQYLSISSLFRFLENFPTLECVSLKFASFDPITTDHQVTYLKLEKLKRFEFFLEDWEEKEESEFGYKFSENIQFFFSLHFLLFCEKLESLQWETWSSIGKRIHQFLESRANKSNEIIEFEGGWRDLSKSNIWDAFPQLHHVKLTYDEWLDNRSRRVHYKEYRNRSLIYSKIRP